MLPVPLQRRKENGIRKRGEPLRRLRVVFVGVSVNIFPKSGDEEELTKRELKVWTRKKNKAASKQAKEVSSTWKNHYHGLELAIVIVMNPPWWLGPNHQSVI